MKRETIVLTPLKNGQYEATKITDLYCLLNQMLTPENGDYEKGYNRAIRDINEVIISHLDKTVIDN